MEPPPKLPPRQAPLNLEKEERQIVTTKDVGTQTPSIDEKSPVEEMKQKLTKPTLGVGLIVYLIINTGQFILGIMIISDCPIQPIIPIYLIIAGVLGIVTRSIPIVNRKRRIKLLDPLLYALLILEFVWMILGSYWIYSIYKPNHNPKQGPHCNHVAYQLAFWFLTTVYISFVLIITIPCGILCCICLCDRLGVSKLDSK